VYKFFPTFAVLYFFIIYKVPLLKISLTPLCQLFYKWSVSLFVAGSVAVCSSQFFGDPISCETVICPLLATGGHTVAQIIKGGHPHLKIGYFISFYSPMFSKKLNFLHKI
jgi:hypothetical protein